MEIRKTQTGVRQRIEMRRVDFAAECAQIRKAPVVGHQHHEIGTLGRRARRRRRRGGTRVGCGIGRDRKRQHAQQSQQTKTRARPLMYRHSNHLLLTLHSALASATPQAKIHRAM